MHGFEMLNSYVGQFLRLTQAQGRIQAGGAIWVVTLPKTYKYNFIHHVFIQIRKQHSRHKAILSSIALS